MWNMGCNISYSKTIPCSSPNNCSNTLSFIMIAVFVALAVFTARGAIDAVICKLGSSKIQRTGGVLRD